MTDKGDSTALANRIADYVETAHTYGQWSKRRAMVEAVRIACDDASHETRRVLDGTVTRQYGLDWVEQVKTVDACETTVVDAMDANPGWKLLGVGAGLGGQTTLTYGWPWPGSQNCGCYTVCERPDACPQNANYAAQEEGR